MKLVDTHCHIHSPDFFSEAEAQDCIEQAKECSVDKVVGIGISLEDSRQAIRFAKKYPDYYYVSIGIHPHEATRLTEAEIDKHLLQLSKLASEKYVVAIGECGLDFFYNQKSELKKQTQLLTGQLEIAQKNNLPVSFHVRSAFEEFWPIYEKYKVQGVLHSFTDSITHLDKALNYGLLIGVNGIATFNKDINQAEMFKKIPLENLLLETDAPYLTPVPLRGTINKPKNVIYITKYLAELRGEDATAISRASTRNARKLFGF